MSLIGTLNIGKSALAVQQAALQVTGSNISNAGNADYTRQIAQTVPGPDQQLRPGVFLGGGIDLSAVQRQIDDALQGRLRGSISDNEAADTTQQWLGRVESIFNALGDQNLSSQLSAFFNSWSNLANKPQDIGLRQVVLQSGSTVADAFQSMRKDLGQLQIDADQQLTSLTHDADQLAQQVADLNGHIVIAEGGTGGQANGLRDQRDAVLKQLAQLIDIKTVQSGSNINVYVGSEPLVFNTQNRGVALRQDSVDGQLVGTVIFKANDGTMTLTGGKIGALSAVRSRSLTDAIGQVDKLAGNLIFELNKLHASGQGLDGFSSVTASNAVADPTAALNDPKSNLAFAPVNGSFVLHVTNGTTGLTTSTLVKVDLDGLNGDETTLNSLAADLASNAGLSVSTIGGKLKIQATSSDVEVSFSQDSSGVLAALGINAFFSGNDARDMAVNSELQKAPSLLAAARNGSAGDNQTALTIARFGIAVHVRPGRRQPDRCISEHRQRHRRHCRRGQNQRRGLSRRQGNPGNPA